jgi:hypothetical protein
LGCIRSRPGRSSRFTSRWGPALCWRRPHIGWLEWLSEKKTKKRFVLLLLRWIGGGRAERRGLLSEYREEYDAEELRNIPRTRKMFILQ